MPFSQTKKAGGGAPSHMGVFSTIMAGTFRVQILRKTAGPFTDLEKNVREPTRKFRSTKVEEEPPWRCELRRFR